MTARVLKYLCSYSMHSALLGDLGGRKSRSDRSAVRSKTATMHFVPVPRRVLLIAESFFRAVIKVASRNLPPSPAACARPTSTMRNHTHPD
jgi:hypothetical protein